MSGSPETARENGKKGGRPPGALTKMSRRKAIELALANRTPLDVMVDNMNFWWDKGKDLGEVLEQQLARISSIKGKEKVKQALSEVNKIATHFLAARENAQRCAVDAAPYVHPRFQSIEFKGQLEVSEVEKISKEMTPDKAKELYASTIKPDSNVSPFPARRVAP
jgi:hypothetical protein